MKKIIAACALIFIVVPVCVGLYLSVSESGSGSRIPATPVSSIVSDGTGNVGLTGLNAVLDVTGAKDDIEKTLRANSGIIAAQLGVDESEVDSAIDSLYISDWEVASLPDGAVASQTVPVSYNGAEAELTLYEDNSYVTLSAYGQDVTLAVPESAQPSLQFLTVVG